MPFSERDRVDQPVSLYAATKKANELIAHSYSHLYGLPTTGLRFFTVYGPWGRPDMAYFLFTKAILGNNPIDVFNQGDMKRDFTYIDDIVEGVLRVTDRIAMPSSTSKAPYRVFNIGNQEPVQLLDFIACIEKNLGKTAEKRLQPMQDGDVPATYADMNALSEWVDFNPTTSLAIGIEKFIDWYLGYYEIQKEVP
jgi:UDP-glucuronate 4-epimerase